MSGHAAPGAPRALRSPWRSLHRQREAATLGIWIFIGSEAMFFAGALLAYAGSRALWPDAFAQAGRETDIVYGSINTALLLTSSFTMAIASQAARADLRTATLACLGLTMSLGLAFLAVKGLEYAQDISERLVPGPSFRLAVPQAQVFFAFYWLLTAVHALHMCIGLGASFVMWWQGWRRTRALASPAFEATALYWHLVDLVWIFLFPLLYLPGRSGP